MPSPTNPQPKNTKKKRLINATQKYAKYSGLAIQMGLIIGLFAYLGLWLDKRFTQGQIFTAILSLFGVMAALYTVIKQLSMDKKAQ